MRKKRPFTRLAAILLTICMMATLLPAAVSASEPTALPDAALNLQSDVYPHPFSTQGLASLVWSGFDGTNHNYLSYWQSDTDESYDVASPYAWEKSGRDALHPNAFAATNSAPYSADDTDPTYYQHNYSYSCMSYTFLGDATLGFDWRVSCESFDADAYDANDASTGLWDSFSVIIDGAVVLQTGGNIGWQQSSFPISGEPTQVHTVAWIYSKDAGCGEEEDCAFVDNITITASDSCTLSGVKLTYKENDVDKEFAANGETLCYQNGTVSDLYVRFTDDGASTYVLYVDGERLTPTGGAYCIADVAKAHRISVIAVRGDCISAVWSCNTEVSYAVREIVTAAPADAVYSFVNDETYPWIAIADFGGGAAVISGNAGQDSTTSALILNLTVPEEKTYYLTFDFTISSESSDTDYLAATLTNFSGEQDVMGDYGGYYYPSDRIETLPVFTKQLALSAGTHAIKWVYTKDGDGYAGADTAIVKNVRITEEPMLAQVQLHYAPEYGTVRLDDVVQPDRVSGILGEEYVLTATQAAGYYFDGWYDAEGNLLDAEPAYYGTFGEEPLTLYAEFLPATEVALTVTYPAEITDVTYAVNGGTAMPLASGTAVNLWQADSVVITANPGSNTFMGFFDPVTQEKLSSANPYTLLMGTEDLALEIRSNADNEFTAIPGFTNPENLTITSRPQYGWGLDDEGYLKSGNQEFHKTVSVLKIVSASDGLLSFTYRMSSEENCDYLLYLSGTELTTGNKTSAENYSQLADYSGEREWTTKTDAVAISAGVPLYFGFVKDGSINSGRDCGWLKDFSLNTNVVMKNVTVSFDSDLGSVSCNGSPLQSGVAVSLIEGQTCTLTQTPIGITAFAGWYAQDGSLLSSDASYSFTVSADTTITARHIPNLFADVAGYTVGEGITSAQTRPTYAWTCDADGVLTSGNAGADSTVSNLKLVIAKTGQLHLEYKVSSEKNWDVLYYRVGTEIAMGNYTSSDNQAQKADYSGEIAEWQALTLTVTAGDVIYFGYFKDGSNAEGSDIAQIRNIAVSSGSVQIAATSSVAACGTVDGGGTYAIGEAVTLTATPAAGCGFYGWRDLATGAIESTQATYRFTALSAKSYQAVFAAAGAYTVRNSTAGLFYPTVKAALDAAQSGDKLELLKNAALTEDATLPAGVMLLLPCMDDDPGYVNGYAPNGTGASGTPSLFRTLTVNAGVTLTVNGTLLVNAVVGREAAGHFVQDITGGYAKIDNQGSIQVGNGGVLDNFGIIEGGSISVADGGKLYDLYVVINWRGGSQAFEMLGQVYPMNEYQQSNITSDIHLTSGASYFGTVRMYASYSYHNTRFPQIDPTNGLIRLAEGATATKTVAAGREEFVLDGGAEFASSTLNVAGSTLTTGSYVYPINGIYSYTLKNGDYRFSQSYKFMPGALLAAENATLTVAADKILVFYDHFDDVDNTSTTEYPADRPAATLTLKDSTLNINGSFAGKILCDAEKPGVIRRAAGSTPLTVTTKEANGYTNGVRDIQNSFSATRTNYSGAWVENTYVWTGDLHTITFDTDGGSAIAAITAPYASAVAAPAAPAKTGYTFAGWDKQIPATIPAENITLTASWTANTYQVAFNANGGSGSMAPQSFTYDAAAKNLTANAFTRNGYGFTGWTTVSDGTGTAYTDGQSVQNLTDAANGTVTLYARWTANPVTVHFDTDGGDELADGTVAFNAPYGALPVPTREGHTFTGWLLGEDPIDAESVVETAESHTLTATWSINTYTITFNTDGGTAVEAVTRAYGQALGELPATSKAGYRYNGWSNKPATMPAHDLELTAGFSSYLELLLERDPSNKEEALVTPRYYYSMLNDAMKAEYDTVHAAHKEKLWTAIHDFEVSALEKAVRDAQNDVNATLREDGKAIANLSVNSNNTVDILMYNPNYLVKGLLDKPIFKQLFAYNGVQSIHFPALDGDAAGLTPYAGKDQMQLMLRVAYATVNEENLSFTDFVNWLREQKDTLALTALDGKELTVVLQGTTEEGVSYEVTYHLNFFNQYHNVTFICQSTDGTELSRLCVTLAYQEEHAYYIRGITGYTKPASSKYIYMGKTDETVYVIYTPNTYEVSFDLNYENAPTLDPVNAVFDSTYDLPTPTRDGYTFLGWFDADGNEVKDNDKVTYAKDIALKASWELGDPFEITYDLDGGSLPEGATNATQFTRNTATFTLNNPVKTGHTFLGWTGSNGTTPETAVAVERGTAEDLHFVANWDADEYTITFNTDGGSAVAAITQDFGTPITAPEDPTKTGYDFSGWNDDIPATMPAENITLTAQWTERLDTPYVIQHWGQTLTGGYALLYTETDKTGKTNLLVAAEALTFEGFTYKPNEVLTVSEGTIHPEGTLVLKLYYSRNSYTVTYMDGEDEVLPQQSLPYGAVLTPSTYTKAGYRFDGWENAPATMPAQDLKLTALYTAYLDLLLAIEDPSAELATARGYYAELTAQMKADYAETAHKQLLWTAIQAAEQEKLTQAVLAAQQSTNATLLEAGKAIAVLRVDEKQNVEVCIEQPDYLAYGMLSKPFFKELFAYEGIQAVHFPALEGDSANLTPYAGKEQIQLMLRVAYITLNDDGKTYSEFNNWLVGEKDRLTVGVLDGKEVQAVLRGKSVEGVEYAVRYAISFYNKSHTLTVYCQTTDGTDLVSPGMQMLDYGEAYSVDAPDITGYTAQAASVDGTMGKTDAAHTIVYTPNTYTVSFDLNYENAPTLSAVSAVYDAAYDLPSPTRPGYVFDGWYLGTQQIKDNDTVAIARDIMLKAHWEVGEAFSVTYELAGGALPQGKTNPTQFNVETASFTLHNPERTGYRFLGWTGSNGEVPQTLVTVEKGTAQNLRFVANWQIKQYTLTFNTDGGSTIDPITQDYDSPIAAPADPTKTGYTFNGWDSELPETMPAENRTLTAQWNLNTYTVAYVLDGGSLPDGVTNATQFYVISESFTLNNPEKTGFTFLGWTGGGVATPQKSVTVAQGTAENLTFIANWQVNRYTVTYATGGGSVIDPMTQDFGSAITAPADPTKTGYDFAGWDTEIPASMPAENITVTALWTPKTFNVSFDANGGSAVSAISVTYDAPYGELPSTERMGYTFLGWFTAPSGGSAVGAETVVKLTENQTLYAHWNAKGDTPYRIEHYRQNLEGEDYTLFEAVQKNDGKAGNTVEAEQKVYTGFLLNTEKSTLSAEIDGYGNTVFKLYYDREVYSIRWVLPDREVTQDWRYGALPVFTDTAREDDDFGSYTFLGWDTEPVAATADAVYTATYDKSYEAITLGENGQTWRTLAIALANAKGGDTVRLEQNATLSENATVPAGVTLLLPCMDDDAGYVLRNGILMNPDGTDAGDATGLGRNAALYRSLAVPAGVTLRVEGTLLVNAITGRPAAGHFDQDVTGGYAQIDLAGELTVENGGLLDAFGFVKGSGSVTVNDGGTAGDLYVVRHWRGGSQALKMYENGIYPMNEYDCHNIETLLRINAGGSLEGLVKMYASGSYNYTRFPQVEKENGLLRLADGAYVLRTFKDGRESFAIFGGADFASSSLLIVGIRMSTAKFLYPIDGDIDFTLNSGSYRFVNDYKMLPGVTLRVNGDADLTLAEGCTLVFYRKFNDLPNTGSTQYPADRAAATLRLTEGARFTNKGTFAGSIYTESRDILVGENPAWETDTKESNGYAPGKPKDEQTVTLTHTLYLERPGHTWAFGEGLCIVWDGEKADYTAVETALAKIPADLSGYTAQSVAALQAAIAAVIYDLTVDKQQQVNAYAAAIEAALANLREKEAPCDGGEACPCHHFTDMPKSDNWAHEGIDFMVRNGLFKGVADNRFDPDGVMTRAMLVTVLWRLEGKPVPTQPNPFDDVPAAQWYTEATLWAAEHGIVEGVGNGRFDPNGSASREQIALILFRYAAKKGYDTGKTADLSHYPDAGKVSAWAKDALCWAVAEGIINGSDGRLLPAEPATRAQVAAILARFIQSR